MVRVKATVEKKKLFNGDGWFKFYLWFKLFYSHNFSKCFNLSEVKRNEKKINKWHGV